jgi:hypothetical protein
MDITPLSLALAGAGILNILFGVRFADRLDARARMLTKIVGTSLLALAAAVASGWLRVGR